MVAGAGDQSLWLYVPGERGQMGARIAGGRDLRTARGQRIREFAGEHIIKRNHSVRRISSEAANEADRERLGGDVHGQIEMINRSDPLADDKGAGADASQRSDRIGTAPQQRQWHRDETGPEYREQRKNAFDSVGELHGDNGITTQSHAPQTRADRPDGPIGLRIGQAAWRAVDEAFAIGWINQREGTG